MPAQGELRDLSFYLCSAVLRGHISVLMPSNQSVEMLGGLWKSVEMKVCRIAGDLAITREPSWPSGPCADVTGSGIYEGSYEGASLVVRHHGAAL